MSRKCECLLFSKKEIPTPLKNCTQKTAKDYFKEAEKITHKITHKDDCFYIKKRIKIT